jgi:multidrug efflux system membrane fusion protein
VVPEAAVQRSVDGSFVYVIDAEKKAQARPVQVAQLQDGIAVITGVQAGEHVVVSGQYKVKPGAPVSEVPMRSASAASVARNGQ